MNDKSIDLTEAEWAVMECLWERSPRTGREITGAMGEKCGWSRSTTLTLLARLEAKGAVTGGSGGGPKEFRPAVSREEAAARETESFLGRVYRGSISMMVNTFAKQERLSPGEIRQLYDILDGLEAEDKDD